MTSIELIDIQPVKRLWVRRATRVAAEPNEGARRLLNVAVAGVGLVVTAPLMLLIAGLVKLTSPGPVFYTQTRIGLDRRNPLLPTGNSRRTTNHGGRPFRIYKFRTMRTDQPDPNSQVWASQDDPRITTVGRVLRRYRLDELPQLINVLLGDMNVVGPRPEQPQIFQDLAGQVDRYQERQRVRPGITGWAQVNQSYDTCVDDVRRKVAFDLEYVSRQSLSEDLRIMLRTAPVMLFKRGSF